MYFMLMSLFHISVRVASGSYHIGSIKSDMLLQYPEFHKEIEFFTSHDPSHKSKYLKWQLKILKSNQAKEQEILDVTELFDKYGQNLLKKDIYQYSHEDFTDLRDELFKIRDKKEEREKKVDDRYKLIDHPDSEQIYESEKYLVLWIKNKAASIHHGQDTKWCISMKGKGYFEDYESSNVVFFFVLNKQAESRSSDSKIAIVYQRDKDNKIKKTEFFNAKDEQLGEPKFNKLIGPESSKILSITESKALQVPKSILAKLMNGEATEEEINKLYEFANKQEDEPKLKILGLIARSPNAPLEILAKLSQDKNMSVRVYVADNPNTSSEILAQLSQDSSKDVRVCVAQNPNTRSSILAGLAQDKDISVRACVARNPNIPSEILAKLSQDKDISVRGCVAQNPNTSSEILAQLSQDKNKYVRGYVAHNPNTSSEILVQMSQDPDEFVRAWVAKNSNTRSSILAGLAQDEDKTVRGSVALNSNTSSEILVQMSQDPN